jgi:hypothetical protein
MAFPDEKDALPALAPKPTHSDSSTTPTPSIDEKTKLKHDGTTPSRSSTDSSTPGFEPIRTTPAPTSRSTPGRRLSAETIDTLRRERSNNGWGCDDIEADAAGTGGAVAPYNHPGPGEVEKDPYEVGWEGGDSDPLCPRSLPTWRKWVVIGIASTGSFCV